MEGGECRADKIKEQIGEETKKQEGDDKNESGDEAGGRQVGYGGRIGSGLAHKNRSIRPQSIDGGHDDAPQREDSGQRQPQRAARSHVLEGTEENEQFAGEVGQTRQSDAGEGGQTEHQSESWRLLGEAAKAVEMRGAGGGADDAIEEKEQGDGQAVGEHEEDGAGEADQVMTGDAEENVTHVHDRGMPEHEVQFPLGDSDESDPEDVAEQREEQQVEDPGRL